MPESAMVAQPTGRGPNNQSDGLVLRVAITALRRWWLLAVPSGVVLAAVAVAVVVLTFEPSYRAVAVVQIKSYQPHIVFNGALTGARSFVSTQRELIRSRLVLGPLIAQPEIASLPELIDRSDPIRHLAETIAIGQISDSELYEISFIGPSPDNAAKIVNAAVQKFFEFNGDAESRRADRVIDLLKVESDHHGQRVALLRKVVRELSMSLTGQDPSAVRPSMNVDDLSRSRLAYLETEIVKNVVDQAMNRSQLTAIKELPKRFPIGVPEATVDALVADNEEVQDLVDAIAQRRKMQQSISLHSALGEKDPVQQKISQEIRQELETLERTRERVALEVKANIARQQELDVHQLNSATGHSRGHGGNTH